MAKWSYVSECVQNTQLRDYGKSTYTHIQVVCERNDIFKNREIESVQVHTHTHTHTHTTLAIVSSMQPSESNSYTIITCTEGNPSITAPGQTHKHYLIYTSLVVFHVWELLSIGGQAIKWLRTTHCLQVDLVYLPFTAIVEVHVGRSKNQGLY